MKSLEIISKKEYLASAPLIVHSHIVSELQFQLQVPLDEEQLVYCRHIETMATFIKPKIPIDTEILAKEDQLPFIVAINLKVIKMLNNFGVYNSYKGILEEKIEFLTSFTNAAYFTTTQKQALKEFML